MFNCEKCYENPCVCGYEYKNKSNKEMANFIHGILKYHDEKEVLTLISKMTESE